jgi:hypothetical protein
MILPGSFAKVAPHKQLGCPAPPRNPFFGDWKTRLDAAAPTL